MRFATPLFCLLLAFAAAGCHDETKPATPPAAPRGLYSVTGNGSVTLHWLANTEANVTGYRIYKATCPDGNTCPYDRVGSVGSDVTSFTVTGLTNGVTRFFAIAAVNTQNRESDLTYETVYDTPRPEGTDAVIGNYRGNPRTPAGAGWDFSAAAAVSSNNPLADIVYSDTLGISEMYAADASTDIQDAGYSTTLDHVDFAPSTGWSPTGTVELITGHCYVVWTRDNHYAKFRVTSMTHTAVAFDWAYQTDPGNGELKARRAGHGAANALQAVVTQR
jgi:hypothetical protein